MTITIECPACQTGFPVDPAKIPAAGVKVRCAVCSEIFRVERPAPEAPAPPVAAPPVAAPPVVAPPVATPPVAAPPVVAVPPTPAPPVAEKAPEPKPEVAPTPEPEVKAEPKVEPIPEPKPEAKAEPVVSGGWETPITDDTEVTSDSDDSDDSDDSGGWDLPPLESEMASSDDSDDSDDSDTEDAEPSVAAASESGSSWDTPITDDPPQDEADEDVSLSTPADELVVDEPLAVETDSDAGSWETAVPDEKDDAAVGSGWDLPESTSDGPRDREKKVDTADPDDWVIEVEETIDPADVDVQRVGTVEEVVAEAREEAGIADAAKVQPMVPGNEDDSFAGYQSGDDDFAVAEAPVTAAEPEAEPKPEPAPAAPVAPAGFQFGKRDPQEKARRLARVLVSDMITYNPERHTRAIAAGTIEEDFEDEIKKSWSEYVDQIGVELAKSTDYWKDALNDILAGGKSLF